MPEGRVGGRAVGGLYLYPSSHTEGGTDPMTHLVFGADRPTDRGVLLLALLPSAAVLFRAPG